MTQTNPEIVHIAQKTRKKKIVLKNSLFFFLLASLMFSGIANGQKYDSELEYIKKTFKEDKKEMVSKFLKLNEKEGPLFWATYDDYEQERIGLGQERWESLNQYMEDYETMDNAKSSEWLKKIYKFNDRSDNLIKTTSEKIEEDLGGRRAIQFYEIETFFNLEIRSWIYSEFPLVGERDK